MVNNSRSKFCVWIYKNQTALNKPLTNPKPLRGSKTVWEEGNFEPVIELFKYEWAHRTFLLIDNWDHLPCTYLSLLQTWCFCSLDVKLHKILAYKAKWSLKIWYFLQAHVIYFHLFLLSSAEPQILLLHLRCPKFSISCCTLEVIWWWPWCLYFCTVRIQRWLGHTGLYHFATYKFPRSV